MSTPKILFVIALALTCFCEIQCKRSARSRGSSRSRHGAHDLNVQYGPNKSSGGQHQLDGEISTKIGSAPTALDSRFNSSPPKDQGFDQVSKQAMDPLLSPNPQKPTGWNVGALDVGPKHNFKIASSHFNHPGHGSGNNNNKIDLRNYPNTAYPNTGSYNYYGVGDSYNYGNGYRNDPKQPFPGYYPTPNIGLVPPKGVNFAGYYGNMFGPVFAQHSNNAGVFGRLFGEQKRHGYGSYGNNAYKNVLAGLLIWNLMHGLTSYRYNVYSHYNQPEMIPKNTSLSADDVVDCARNVTMLCETSTKAMCTVNGTIFCIYSESCVDGEQNCAGDTKCVTNVTILGSTGGESVFCVTTFAVPQVSDDGPCKSGNAELCASPKDDGEGFDLIVGGSTTTASR